MRENALHGTGMHRAARAVLKLIVAVALGCTERHLFRKVGSQVHAAELSGTGVGIMVGIKPPDRPA